jgi:hypothetical protein
MKLNKTELHVARKFYQFIKNTRPEVNRKLLGRELKKSQKASDFFLGKQKPPE